MTNPHDGHDVTHDLQQSTPAKSAPETGKPALNETVSLHGSRTPPASQETQGLSASAGSLAFDAATDANSASSAPLPKTGRRASAILHTQVGDYEIVELLGRGGMGVVYRARHKQLNRNVALKMILVGAHASHEQTKRFLIEAQAVAHLQHPNIVQIFDIGEHDDLPYFSLEYVDGCTLSQQLAGKPLPAQQAAQLLETLARAMHYAHENGVLHRDLKPSNVLMTKDGIPKISDFGLAKRMEDDDAGTTRTGTVMGTPSYMSPEQARGESRDVGPSSDQYSLGAMLYELTTGRPPFLAAKPVDTIMQVLHEEPLPPRQLQPKLPVDLETICLKALQKDVHKRYTSCAELAEDLRRFQAGEPILARPVGRLESAWRWCRRNPKLALSMSATALLLLATAVVSATAAFIVNSKNNELSLAAIRIQQEAEYAKSQETLAKQKAADEEVARKQADENAIVAAQQATLALSALQTLIDQVQKTIGDTPGLQDLKKTLLETALKGLNQVADTADKSTSKEATMAAAHMQMGRLYRQLGETTRAFDQFRRCHDIVKERVIIKQGSDASRANLALSCTTMAEMSQDLNRDMTATLAYYREALSIYQEIVDKPKPGEGARERFAMLMSLGEAQTRVGATLFRLGDPKSALTHFEEAARIRKSLLESFATDADIAKLTKDQQKLLRSESQQDLARSLIAIGSMSFRLGDLDRTRTSFADALAVREALFAERPEVVKNKLELARACGMLGEFLLHSGSIAEAQPHLEKSRQLSQEVAVLDEKVVDYQRDLAFAHYRLGVLKQRQNESAASQAAFQACREIRQRLAEQDSSNDRRQMEWMLVLARCGEHQQAASIAETMLSRGAPDNEMLLDIARALAQSSAAVAENDADLSQQYLQRALDAVQKIVREGDYKDTMYLKVEPDFDPLRALPEFTQLIEETQRAQPASS